MGTGMTMVIFFVPEESKRFCSLEYSLNSSFHWMVQRYKDFRNKISDHWVAL